jgi:beta-N-acetylhexosaminidase
MSGSGPSRGVAGRRDLSATGDHFLIGLRPTARLTDEDRALLSDLRPAGVILYKSNFLHDRPYAEWLASHRQLIADVRAAVGRERLLLAIDHEGGRVCRTPAPITRFSYASRWARQAGAVGQAMGRELAALGLNLNFAPVLDIHSNPANPVIGARAFADKADAVAEAALAFAAAMQAEGVLACGKHFPGHGDTDTDSHRELPLLQQDLAALRARELIPFAAAIRAGIPMLMTAHILLPRVDANDPVTLSRTFGLTLLRQELGYHGVVVSDDIGMHAVSRIFDDPNQAVRLIQAGTDLMMVCAHWTDTERARGFATALLEARADGRLTEEQDVRSRARVQRLLELAPQNVVTALPPEAFEQHARAGAQFVDETVEVI